MNLKAKSRNEMKINEAMFEEFPLRWMHTWRKLVTVKESKVVSLRESRIVYVTRDKMHLWRYILVCVSYYKLDFEFGCFFLLFIFYMDKNAGKSLMRWICDVCTQSHFHQGSSDLFLPRIRETLCRRHVYHWRHYAQAYREFAFHSWNSRT